MADPLKSATVGEIVAADFRAASVMERFGIDFGCGGWQSLADACERVSVSQSEVQQALDSLAKQNTVETDLADVGRWPLDRLIDHIVETHHRYVRRSLAIIADHLATLREERGDRHRELACIADAFDQAGADLDRHMVKEERILFPYVKELARLKREGKRASQSPFGTIVNPIMMLQREHREACHHLHFIRELTDGYTPPVDADATYRACMTELADYEHDLHRHVHLENNVVFPRAIALEGD
jgi:regulator of cell morphogenesis and NO signaling